jgi:putative heme-binding domain-containing protein
VFRPLVALTCLGVFALVTLAQRPAQPKPQPKPPQTKPGDTKPAETKPNIPIPLKEPPATDPKTFKVAKDFKVELLYSVPKDKEGSWVNMCVDPKGRLIVSDQYGPLYRITPPPIGGKPEQTKVEQIPVPIGEAHGLLWAFDSLYVVVNQAKTYKSGLYRVRDTNGDDILDEVTLLRPLEGPGEHGPHAVLLHPDGKHLAIVCGNQTKLTSFSKTRVPPFWGEDHLLPRMPDGRGFMAGVLGPGGAIYLTDPDGKDWELFSVGYRNEFDAAFNKDGELFTYDADMEWDFNTPWYRPTRVCLVTSGSEFGWRNGAGKWPPHYPDSAPAIYNVGPGSPTGVCFGYGTKFPPKYHDAFFMCDWSYGKLYALHLTPEGSAYKGELEEFVQGSPLPLTDVVVNPKDGALYFTIGGRKTKSGLYRVTYVGKEPTGPGENVAVSGAAELRDVRHKLEAFHGVKEPKAIDFAWPYLAHPDRFIRSAARVAIEHQDLPLWIEKALNERDAPTAIAAMLALVRVAGRDPFHYPKGPPADQQLKTLILEKLNSMPWEQLNDEWRLDLLRVYAILFNRMALPTPDQQRKLMDLMSPRFPTNNRLLNGDLCQLLVYLQAEDVAAKALKLMADAPTQEEQMEYAKSLRMLRAGWTLPLRKQYFAWFLKAANYRGGMSFAGFLANIKKDAMATLTPQERTALAPILNAQPAATAALTPKPRPIVKQYKMEDLVPLLDTDLVKRDFDRGRRLFGEASCFTCHRFDNEGGAQGPDLTQAAGRFSARDLLESIVEPSKVISDQYVAHEIETRDGKQFYGRIVNHSGEDIIINTNMLDPGTTIKIDRRLIESMRESKVSMMPTGLIDTLKTDEVLDLMAYLLSRGDRSHAMFKK